ncbi:SLC13 family permease [Halalkalibacter urbisdiaboli]|uniref:SLC13 family permease n=1 Tax=Halalkalibacter urbisdiaboli TaxID=1960589 RepID=UPI000B43FB46|nr:SLC13 family permease [Halalkalibacter urbisdiaboli]
MSLEVIVLCSLILIMFVVLINEWLVPELTVFLALSTLVLSGILTPAEALIGFSNTGVHTIALLFIIASAVSKTGMLNELIDKVLSKKKPLSSILLRLMLPVSTLSAFMNNTPIVTMLIPTIQNWGITNRIKPSKLLIPLSYATILGGTITLIGTSANLIIKGLLVEKGFDGLSMFDFAYFGIPLTIIGVIYMVFIGQRLLPNRDHNRKMFQDTQRNYIFQFIIERDSSLIGKTIKNAMLRELHQLFLIQVIRNNQKIIPDPNDEILQAGDILIFSGRADGLIQLQNISGFKLYTGHKQHLLTEENSLVEVVISSTSSLISKKIKQSNFRSKYNAAIVAVQRNSKQITSGIGNIVIKPGDTLLLLTGKGFNTTWSDSEDFYFISPVKQIKKNSTYENMIIVGVLIFFILASILQLLSIYKLALIGAAILLLTNVLSISDAKKAINWSVIILMASSIGVGSAVEKTGLANILASLFTKSQSMLGLLGIMIIFYFSTLILTEIINNLATAALMFPIGYSISVQLNIDPTMFAMLTAIACSCSFLSPIGYQTNLLVYGPGGYKFTDYLKVGLPLSMICMLVTILLAIIKWL